MFLSSATVEGRAVLNLRAKVAAGLELLLVKTERTCWTRAGETSQKESDDDGKVMFPTCKGRQRQRQIRDWPQYCCQKVYWTKMVQNAPTTLHGDTVEHTLSHLFSEVFGVSRCDCVGHLQNRKAPKSRKSEKN